MSISRLESLPRELIAHIATFVEALSVLSLSRTSKTLRTACWDSLIFKEILQASQSRNWYDDCLDVEAITKRAGNDPSIWARYAVADDKAYVLARMRDPLEHRKLSINFLPELAVVKHPFLKRRCWYLATHGPFDDLTSHVFSVTAALLSADDATLSQFHDPGACEYCFPTPRENDSSFLDGEGALWTLCSVALLTRDALKVRRAVWPYDHAANVPHIDFPKAEQIPVRPLSDSYSLPLPFSHRAVDLLNRFIPVNSKWDSWYREHNYALYSSSSFLTEGSWCGYYTKGANPLQLDPPMTEIRFERIRSHESLDGKSEMSWISADDCVDGVGKFGLRGSIAWDGKVVTITARKIYGFGHSWEWDCRLTPFGIVGHWGKAVAGHFRTNGYVWLWKQEWCAQPSEQVT